MGHPRSRRLSRLGLLLSVELAFASALAAGAGAAPPPPIASATAFGPSGGQLIQRAYIVARDQGASAPLGGAFPALRGRSAWIFGDTFLAGDHPGANCDHLALDSQAFSGSPLPDGISVGLDHADAAGAPVEFLPLTPAEGLYDAAHETLERMPCVVDPAPPMCHSTVWGQCDAEYLPNAGALIADPARRRVLLFFDVSWRLRHPPADVAPTEAALTIGAGLASWAQNQHPALRRLYFTHRPGLRQPSPYAFGNGRPPSDDPAPHGAIDYTGAQFGEAPVIPPRQSRYLYLYDTTPPSVHPDCGLVYCYRVKLARVPLSTLTDRSTWRFYDARTPRDPWTGTCAKATYLAGTGPSRVTSAGPPNFSVTYNAYLGRYLMVYQRVLTQTIGYRTARDPWGPWSGEGVVPFREQTPGAGGLTYAAQAHDEFSRQRGKLMYLTYVASNTAGGVFVVKIVFG